MGRKKVVEEDTPIMEVKDIDTEDIEIFEEDV